MKRKVILWDTNFNGKMACQRFLHVDLAPQKLPTAAELETTLFTIKAADVSHQPVDAKITHIIPFRIGELSNIHTWPSHGMDTSDFIYWMHQKNKIHQDTQLAVYYYKKANS